MILIVAGSFVHCVGWLLMIVSTRGYLAPTFLGSVHYRQRATNWDESVKRRECVHQLQ
jgi:hypothetical protein